MKTLIRCAALVALMVPVAAAHAVEGSLVHALRPGEAAPGYGSWLDWRGDYDRDGKPDLVVGAWGGEEDYGAVQVLRSEAGPLWIEGMEYGDGFGVFVGSVGDVDGDDVDDLAVGAPYGLGAGLYFGGVLYIYSGAEVGEAPHAASLEPAIVLLALSDGDRFGWTACGLGDVDGDGYNDFAVGAPFGDNLAGEIHLYGGGPDHQIRWHLIKSNELVSLGELGIFVAPIGDLDGDDRPDFAAGLPLKRIWDSPDGRLPQVWVYLGKDLGAAAPSYKLLGTDDRRLFGWVFAGIGDLDGDGYDDLAVGAPRKRSAPPLGSGQDSGPHIKGTDQGKVWIYRGGAVPDSTAYWHFTGENPDDAFGNAVVGTGDVNGDGFTDLAVGAPEHDSGGDNAGAAYFFLGGAPPDTIPDLLYRGGTPAARFGYSISARRAPDQTGANEVAVGAIDGAYTLVFRIAPDAEIED